MSALTGIIALIAAVLNAIRLQNPQNRRTQGPLAAPAGQKGAAALSDTVPENAALHAPTVGAIGTMLLAVRNPLTSVKQHEA